MSSVGMSSCCISGTLHDGHEHGRVDTIAGLQTYVAEPSTKSTAKSIVLLTDIFGWELRNTRLLADQYAQNGFTVYIPDLFQGDSLPISFLQNVEPPLKTRESLSMVDKATNAVVVPATLGPWLIRHRQAVVLPLMNDFIGAIRQIPGTSKVGALGFCWGGRYAVLQAHGGKTNANGAEVAGVDAAVACHPSMVSVPGDFDAITKPLSLALGEKDGLLNEKSRHGIQGVLDKKTEVPTEIRVYADQVHGFALRGDWSSDEDKKSMDEALKQGIAWFEKYL